MDNYSTVESMSTPNENDLEDFFMDLVTLNEASAYAAVCYDIRGMKVINEQLSRDVGTRIMRRHAHGILELGGEGTFVARRSGDEYQAIFPEVALDDIIEYLQGTEVSVLDGQVIRNISTHAGYYRITDECDNYEDLREILSEALRESKSKDDGTFYAFCDDSVIRELNERRTIAGMFDEAIINEEFLVYYQPKVETNKYQIKGAEALCRWKHDGEMILPYKFIPVYEQNGSICVLDYYMLDHVCRDIRRWLDEGKDVVRVSVNLSREHMGNPNLVEQLINIIDKSNVPHEYIEIELTETSTEVDYLELKEIVNALHDAGIHTSVDDFGVGYSSMNLLIEFPWDMVKIDRSFVPLGTGDEEDKKRLIMLKSIVNMASDLGMECIAEGVETVEQLLTLKRNGCTFIQGYYFDKPLTVEEFEERLMEYTSIMDEKRSGSLFV